MSRSYRKQPFTAVTCCKSAKDDKKHAHRGERNKQNLTIRLALKNSDFENFLLPHKLECNYNEVYSWRRDGNQRYVGLSGRDLYNYYEAIRPLTDEEKIAEVRAKLEGKRWRARKWEIGYTTWPPEWYKRMMRK